jgi:hypothetical protein
MNQATLEGLLYQSESETLDFKVAQYPFDKATNEQKSELLKDILAFANAWRQSDAFILIGVEEVRGGRGVVRGVATHLLNRNLQQFVHSKTNRPVTFAYSNEILDGIEIGVISVPLQDRPIFLAKDFGNLRANVVYIRRGDTTGEANPDEVFRMGSSASPLAGQPLLELDLVEPDARRKLGTKVELESISVELPPRKQIPKLGNGSPLYEQGFPNRNYYIELAQFARDTTFLCPLGIAITNTSTTCAEDVIVTIQIESNGFVVIDQAHLPRQPEKSLIVPLSRQMLRDPEPTVSVVTLLGGFEIRAEIGTIQAGRTEWSADVFYIGARENRETEASATVFANNLRVPINVVLKLGIKAASRSLEPHDLYLDED